MQNIFDAIKNSAILINNCIYSSSRLYSNKENFSGDKQLELDIQTDLIIENELKKVNSIKTIASEEKEKEKNLNPNAKYLVAYDPLDGSSLLDANLSIGSIFGIYENSFCGKNIKAAAYVLYGPRTEIVIAKENACLYLLKNDKLEYLKELKLKDKGNLNSPGGHKKFWLEKHNNLIEAIFKEGHRLRYSGGMVPDLHHILIKGGGLFSYPCTKKEKKGKLRMIFEVFPFAKIYESSGGYAINSQKRLLELKPENIHDTTPCFFGSKFEIDMVKKFYDN